MRYSVLLTCGIHICDLSTSLIVAAYHSLLTFFLHLIYVGIFGLYSTCILSYSVCTCTYLEDKARCTINFASFA